MKNQKEFRVNPAIIITGSIPKEKCTPEMLRALGVNVDAPEKTKPTATTVTRGVSAEAARNQSWLQDLKKDIKKRGKTPDRARTLLEKICDGCPDSSNTEPQSKPVEKKSLLKNGNIASADPKIEDEKKRAKRDEDARQKVYRVEVEYQGTRKTARLVEKK